MVRHPIQAVSFPHLFTGVIGSVSASDFGVFLPKPSADSHLHVPLKLGEHSRSVAVVKLPNPPSHSLIDPSNDLFRLLPERVARGLHSHCLPQCASAFGTRFAVRVLPKADWSESGGAYRWERQRKGCVLPESGTCRKRKAILERQMNRLTEELLKIDTALRKSKRKQTDVGKIERAGSGAGGGAIQRRRGSRMWFWKRMKTSGPRGCS